MRIPLQIDVGFGDAVVGMANSRIKDFCDLWVLSQRFEFERATLASAIRATFETRRTQPPSPLPLSFTADF